MQEDVEPNSLHIIFLLGAGASRPAGIPTIDEMTTEFLKEQSNDMIGASVEYGGQTIDIHDFTETILQTLVKATQDYFGKSDLELFLSLLIMLEDRRLRGVFEQKYPSLKELEWDTDNFLGFKTARSFKQKMESFIRTKCEGMLAIDYLQPLRGLLRNTPLNIFTLNYDGTVEIFCESNNIPYTDGFNPYWNHDIFLKDGPGVNLFKLHGSLYWLRSASGKTMKVPLKGLVTSDLRYLTDESLSEMMIYPALNKNKEPLVYSWLSQKFKDELSNSDVCIVIGYSFRDEDIRQAIIESLSNNHKLWLIVISPHASIHKAKWFGNQELSSRILAIDLPIEIALTDRILHSNLQSLENARKSEEGTWLSQYATQIRLDQSWVWILRNYLGISFYDRVKWIVERLYGMKFSGVSGTFPECVEGVVGHMALANALEYLKQGNRSKLQIWRDIFLKTATSIEYKYFSLSHQSVMMNGNPVNTSELPMWCSKDGGSYVQPFSIEYENGLRTAMTTPDIPNEIKQPLSKLLDSLNFLNNQGRHLMNSEPGKLLDIYRDRELGLLKWARKTIENLSLK